MGMFPLCFLPLVHYSNLLCPPFFTHYSTLHQQFSSLLLYTQESHYFLSLSLNYLFTPLFFTLFECFCFSDSLFNLFIHFSLVTSFAFLTPPFSSPLCSIFLLDTTLLTGKQLVVYMVLQVLDRYYCMNVVVTVFIYSPNLWIE